MSYFITENTLAEGSVFEVSGSEYKHLTLSRRESEGSKVEFQDPNIKRWICEVLSITKSKASLKAIKQIQTPQEPSKAIHLFQALTSDQSLDLIVQKSTELGVLSINIFIADHSPYHKTDSVKKLTRWNTIAIQACKQSGRPNLPIITISKSLKDALSLAEHSNLYLLSLPDSEASKAAKQVKTGEISLLTGPEGGFSKAELDLLEKTPHTNLVLGTYVLRSETATIAGLGALLNT